MDHAAIDRLPPDRARAVRLFEWLEDIRRLGGGQTMLSYAWTRLAGLLGSMPSAEQAIRAAVRDARQHDPGCTAWWQSVQAARSALDHNAGIQQSSGAATGSRRTQPH